MNTQQLKELAKLADSEVTWILLPKDLANDGWCTEVVNYISVVSPSTITALADRIEAAERERDELRAEQAEHDEQIARMESKFSLAKRALDSKTARCEKAEAELRRRDAAAGEASDRIVDDGDGQQIGGIGVSDRLNCLWPIGTKFYTAAQPAVLPPDITFESKGFISLTSEDFAYNRALEDTRKLGAQPQKPVICPPVQYLSKYAADDGHCTTGKLVPNKRTELRDTEWREALDAAGVKWEVKK